MQQTTATEQFDKILAILTAARIDAVKFDSGNASAGTRVRAAAQEAKEALQELRKLVQETKNARASAE
jgi:hypothetical protein